MKVHFCGPTGANAMEAAIKLCKTATGRGDIVSFQGGYHGGSHAAMARDRAGRAEARRSPTACPGVHFFPYSYCGRLPARALRATPARPTAPGCWRRSLLDPNGGVPRPAAVILELVQGEGGVIPADPDFVRRVRALTRELDMPLVVDEVQTGCGRTGTWFAFEQYDIEPDVIVASKALSGIGTTRRDDPVRRAAGRVGARRAHRHVPRQPAGLRRGRGGGADRAPRRRAGQRTCARRRRSPTGSRCCACTRGCARSAAAA